MHPPRKIPSHLVDFRSLGTKLPVVRLRVLSALTAGQIDHSEDADVRLLSFRVPRWMQENLCDGVRAA